MSVDVLLVFVVEKTSRYPSEVSRFPSTWPAALGYKSCLCGFVHVKVNQH